MDSESGFSLVECLLTIVIVSSIVFLVASIPNSLGLVNKAKHTSTALQIASKQIEDKRTVRYRDLVIGESSIEDLRLSLLPQATGQIVVEDCSLQICPNNEHAKLVSVSVHFRDNSNLQTVILKTLISREGLNRL